MSDLRSDPTSQFDNVAEKVHWCHIWRGHGAAGWSTLRCSEKRGSVSFSVEPCCKEKGNPLSRNRTTDAIHLRAARVCHLIPIKSPKVTVPAPSCLSNTLPIYFFSFHNPPLSIKLMDPSWCRTHFQFSSVDRYSGWRWKCLIVHLKCTTQYFRTQRPLSVLHFS